MRVLVTGASGFIGRHLLAKFNDDGIDYVTMGRNDWDHKKNIRFDLLSSESIQIALKKVKPTHLIHLAWYTEHGKYWESSLNINWLLATNRLVEAFCQGGGRHVLIAGTCAEYDWRYGYCVEDLTPLNPQTLYGIAKNSTRIFTSQICEKYRVKFSWARIFFPYGPGESKGRLIPSLFDYFCGERQAFGVNIHSYRDFLHVSDVAEAINLCLKKEVYGDINISSGQPVLLECVVRAIASRYGKLPDSILSVQSKRVDEPIFLVGDNKKLRNLGWNQKISLIDGIQYY